MPARADVQSQLRHDQSSDFVAVSPPCDFRSGVGGCEWQATISPAAVVVRRVAAGAVHGFRTDVASRDDAREETREIEFDDVAVDSYNRIEIESTAVGEHDLLAVLHVFRAVLFPRDQHAILHRLTNLHGGDR